MSVKVRDRLSSGRSILDGNVEARSSIHSFDHPSNLLDSQKEVGELGMVEIREPSGGSERRYKDMSG